MLFPCTKKRPKASGTNPMIRPLPALNLRACPCRDHDIPFPGTHSIQLRHSPDSLSMGEIIKYAKVDQV